MAKFKPARRRQRPAAAPAGGLPCVILVIGALLLGMLFLYFVMKYSAA